MAEEDGYALLKNTKVLPIQPSLLPDASAVGQSSPLSSDTVTTVPVPAIALTGYATKKDRERAFAAGYQMHLAKPIEPDDLVSAIKSVLKTAKRE
jgi:CheY-like chemotaxis protein